jgi:hypothetical protein
MMPPPAASNTDPNKSFQSSTSSLSPEIVDQWNEIWRPEVTGTPRQMTDTDSDDHQ